MTTVPVRVDVVTFTDELDVDGMVRQLLSGSGGFGSHRGDAAPVDWLFRAYPRLAGTPYADRLAGGVAVCLTDPEPMVRSQALLFFASLPLAAGGERLARLAAGDRASFAGVADPLATGRDLEWRLLETLAARLVAVDDEAAVAVAKAEVLRPGRARPVVGGLFAAAPEWVLQHAEAIVGGTPAAGITLLVATQRAGGDLVGLGRRIAPLCREDNRFLYWLDRAIDDAGARRAIRDAYAGRLRA